MTLLTQDRLKQVLDYNPDTGSFTWAMNRKKCTKGKDAGSPHSWGYKSIRVDYKRYFAHRLAWLYMTGRWPEQYIDHKNGDPSDDRWCNLREATPSQNQHNKRMKWHSQTGLKGVSKTGSGKYTASLKVGPRHIHCGSFDTPEEAHAAYAQAAQQHFGEFARV